MCSLSLCWFMTVCIVLKRILKGSDVLNQIIYIVKMQQNSNMFV